MNLPAQLKKQIEEALEKYSQGYIDDGSTAYEALGKKGLGE